MSANTKPKRELAEKNIRIYPSTLQKLQERSWDSGKSIARIVSELTLSN